MEEKNNKKDKNNKSNNITVSTNLLKKKIAIAILIIFCIITFALLFIYLTEYKPKDIENIHIFNKQSKKIQLNTPVNILTYNIGFASLDDKQDFFLDGGNGYGNLDKNEQIRNLNGISNVLNTNPSDIYMLQEVDFNCTRTHNVNQIKYLRNSLSNYSSSFALFHKVEWIPYPLEQMMGHVESGLTTLNSFNGTSSRIKLACAYAFPESAFMFKRPLLKTIIPIEDSTKKLVLFNLHLEAYDSNGTRIKQLETLRNEMQQEYNKGNYVVAGGDFNQLFPDDEKIYPIINKDFFVVNTIESNLFSNDFTFQNDYSHPTSRLLDSPNTNQFYVIDGFITSNNINVINTKVINTNFEFSDHNPVQISFELN